MANLALAKQFNDQIRGLLEWKVKCLGPSKETKAMTVKLDIFSKSAPWCVYDLWVVHVCPYGEHIKARNKDIFDTPEIRENSVFKAFGVCTDWQRLNEQQQHEFWELINHVMMVCAHVFERRQPQGIMDGIKSVMSAFKTKDKAEKINK